MTMSQGITTRLWCDVHVLRPTQQCVENIEAWTQTPEEGRAQVLSQAEAEGWVPFAAEHHLCPKCRQAIGL